MSFGLAPARCTATAAQSGGALGLLATAGRVLGLAGQRQASALHASAWQRDDGSEQPPQDKEQQRKAMVNRVLYRSRQRGFLELDLLIGMWAEREVPTMATDLVQEFEVVLDQENPDMFKWITQQEQAPPELQANRAFQALQAHVKSMTDRHHSVPSTAGEERKEWVRGWTDSGKELETKQAAAAQGSQ